MQIYDYEGEDADIRMKERMKMYESGDRDRGE